MVQRLQRQNPQVLPPLPSLPLHGLESHARKNRNSQRPHLITNRHQKLNPVRMDLTRAGRTGSLRYHPHLGPSIQFILRLSLVRLFLTVGSCRHSLHRRNISWGRLVGSYRTTVYRLGATAQGERSIPNDEFVPYLRRTSEHILDGTPKENPGFVSLVSPDPLYI